MTTPTIKAGDDAGTFSDALYLDSVAINLTGCSVLFLMRKDGGVVFSATATIVSAAAGTVRYTIGTGFPTTPGKYKQEWQITQANSKILTVPSNGYNEVIILDDLN